MPKKANTLYISMNDDYKFDVDMALARVQLDPDNPFSNKEMPSINLLNDILDSKIELKGHRQALRTFNLFIEFEIDNAGDGIIVDSGISKTEAKYYFMDIDEMGITLSVAFLKHLLLNKDNPAYGIEVKCNDKTANDHIGYGIIIPMYRLMELYMLYYTWKCNESVRRLKRNLDITE